MNKTLGFSKASSVVITWSWFAWIKFQPVQPGRISPYDYMKKLNFIPVRRSRFPPGICLHLYIFSSNSSFWSWHLRKTIIYFHWFKYVLLELLSPQLWLLFLDKMMKFCKGVCLLFFSRHMRRKNTIEISSIYWKLTSKDFFKLMC